MNQVPEVNDVVETNLLGRGRLAGGWEGNYKVALTVVPGKFIVVRELEWIAPARWSTFISTDDASRVGISPSEIEQVSQRQKGRDLVDLEVAKGDFARAHQHYEAHCTSWWDAKDFHEFLAQEVSSREERLTRERAELERREQANRRDLKAQVMRELRAGNPARADQIYEKGCAKWWKVRDYSNEKERALRAHQKSRASEEKKRRDQERGQSRAELLTYIEEVLNDNGFTDIQDVLRLAEKHRSGELHDLFSSVRESKRLFLESARKIDGFGRWKSRRKDASPEQWREAASRLTIEHRRLDWLLALEGQIAIKALQGIGVGLGQIAAKSEPKAILDYVSKLRSIRDFLPQVDQIVLRLLEQLVSNGEIELLEILVTSPGYDWSPWLSAEHALRFVERGRDNERFASEFLETARSGSLLKLDELFLQTRGRRDLSDEEYLSLKSDLLRQVIPEVSLDAEQLCAISSPYRTVLTRARAGSGKTRTLCARAAVAVRDEGLDPAQVLILAFNKTAADEVRLRMRQEFGFPAFENARTFHGLAYQLAKPKKRLLHDEGQHISQRAQSRFVQSLLERIMNPAFKRLLYQFFRKEVEEIERLGRDLSPEDYKAFRRSLEQVTLKGERVKSTGEKYIADFLFEHDIPYTYEQIWGWDEVVQGQPYRPDFTLVANGVDVVLEHWALDPRSETAELPDDWDITAEQYRQQIRLKREVWAKKRIRLIETHTGELVAGREAFEATLKERFESSAILCKRLSDEEIVRRVFETDFQISRMAGQFLQFIQRAKKRCLTAGGVAELIAERTGVDERLDLFYQLALRVYREYETALDERGEMDFDDLLREATEQVNQTGGDASIHLGEGRFVRVRDLRWILVDEYQDFSELYHGMLAAVMRANPAIRLMAVGDDWQAINGFAGAELRFFNDFERFFEGSGYATMTTNYRSARTLVAWGNALMEGLGPTARPRSDAVVGEARVVALSREWIEFRRDSEHESDRVRDSIFLGNAQDGNPPTLAQLRLARVMKVCARLYQQAGAGALLLLSRTRRAYGLELADLRSRVVDVLGALTGEDCESLRKKIRVMTAHTAKGQEEQAVVILDASQANFPKIHPDNLLWEMFGVTPADVLAEERRLFYVAITRPARVLWILAEDETKSPYVKQLLEAAPAARSPVRAAADVSSRNRERSGLFRRLSACLATLPSRTGLRDTTSS